MRWRNDRVRGGGLVVGFGCGTGTPSCLGLLRWRGAGVEEVAFRSGPVRSSAHERPRGHGQAKRREGTESHTPRDVTAVGAARDSVDACRDVPCAARVYQT
nr:unnamed protein product [Digitaria exilis]